MSKKIKLSEIEISQGITNELIQTAIKHNKFNPSIIPIEGELLNLNTLECSNGYWVNPVDEPFLKDSKGNLLVIDQRTVIIGRARWLVNNRQYHFENEIKIESELLIERVKANALEFIKSGNEMLSWIDMKEGDFNTIIRQQIAQVNPGYYEKMEQFAKKTCTTEFIESLDRIKSLLVNEDWDSLYILLFQKGLPEIRSFKLKNEKDMAALIENFHANKINETIYYIKGHSHIYNVAKINVSKKFI